MKLLSLYYTHKPGGFCKRLYRLLNAAAARGHEVHYLTLDTPPRALGAGVTVHRIPFPMTARRGLPFWALFTVFCPLYAAWIARKIHPDRYIVFGAYYSTMLCLARLIHRRPCVLFLRSLVFRIDRITGKPLVVRKLAALVERIGMWSATTIVCMTEAMRSELIEFLGRRAESAQILPNDVPSVVRSEGTHTLTSLEALSPRLLENLSDQTLLVLASGVLDERKNVGLLLDAFRELLREFSPRDVSLIVAGDGPLLRSYLARAKLEQLENVHFTGWLDTLAPVYARADLVLHPSVHEGMPNSVLEALGWELPVLAADIPEMREMLQSSFLLFDPADPDQLAARLREFLNDPGELERAKAHASAAAKRLRFDWDTKACEMAGATSLPYRSQN